MLEIFQSIMLLTAARGLNAEAIGDLPPRSEQRVLAAEFRATTALAHSYIIEV
jgi:hypothetical protein